MESSASVVQVRGIFGKEGTINCGLGSDKDNWFRFIAMEGLVFQPCNP